MSGSWMSDPSGRHEERWFDGRWTEQVRDRGVANVDLSMQGVPSAGGVPDPGAVDPSSWSRYADEHDLQGPNSVAGPSPFSVEVYPPGQVPFGRIEPAFRPDAQWADPVPSFVPVAVPVPVLAPAAYFVAVPPAQALGTKSGLPSVNGLAIASMVLGIVGAVFSVCYAIGFPCAIVGLALGGVALRKINNGTADPEGRGMAVTGVVLSIITLVVAAVVLALVLDAS